MRSTNSDWNPDLLKNNSCPSFQSNMSTISKKHVSDVIIGDKRVGPVRLNQNLTSNVFVTSHAVG